MKPLRKLDKFFSSRNALMNVISILWIFLLVHAIMVGYIFGIILYSVLLVACHYKAIKRFIRNKKMQIKWRKRKRPTHNKEDAFFSPMQYMDIGPDLPKIEPVPLPKMNVPIANDDPNAIGRIANWLDHVENKHHG